MLESLLLLPPPPLSQRSMTFFRLPFFRLSRKPTPIVATNMALDSWCHQSYTQSTRFVQKVELCTALCTGEDAWGTPVRKGHHHTLLRVSVVPADGSPKDTLLIERILSTGGAFHSVTPIEDTLSPGGTLLHPDVHDRMCVITEGPSTALAHGLQVERTLTLSDGKPSLGQLAHIIAFVSRMTAAICDGGDCTFQSRAFAFTCLTALAPTLPPRETGQTGGAINCGADKVDDSVFELTSEALLGQFPWLVSDADRASWKTIALIDGLKYANRGQARARLYH